MDEMMAFHFEEEGGLQPWETLRMTEGFNNSGRLNKVTLGPPDPEAQKACTQIRIEAYKQIVEQANDIEAQKRLAPSAR